jgi:hypothetical protein
MPFEINQFISYCQKNYNSFELLNFYRHFKFSNRENAEKAFKKIIGRVKREYSDNFSD